MKRILALVALCAAMSFATTSIGVGVGSSQGGIGVEQTFKEDHIGVNAHLSGIGFSGSLDYLELGLGLAYRFTGLTGPYVFHTSNWLHKEYEDQIDNGSKLSLKSRNVNYWSLVFGVGYQHMFFKHFGGYFEVGSGFYAGEGSYYMHFDEKTGHLNNDGLEIRSGFGLKFSF